MPGVKFLRLCSIYCSPSRACPAYSGRGRHRNVPFYSVQAMQQGVREATVRSANDTRLVVYTVKIDTARLPAIFLKIMRLGSARSPV